MNKNDGDTHQSYSEEDGNAIISTYQDVAPHLKYASDCRRVEREDRGSLGRRGDMQRVMSVPVNVIYAVAQQLGIPLSNIFGREEQKRIWSELKRPEFQGFRTTNDRKIGK